MSKDKSNLAAAKKAKNDEFYTRKTDIEKELQHYESFLINKTILMPCDNPELIIASKDKWPPEKRASQFWVYFHQNFKRLKLKEIIATHYSKDGNSYVIKYDGVGDDMDINICKKIPLKSDGDFRTDEIKSIIDVSDIVITNPPFSLFREFVDLLIQKSKKFLIIGSKNAYTYKEIFKLIQTDKIWSGYNNVKEFNALDLETNQINIKKFGNIGWFTNINVKKRYEEITLYKKYSSSIYKKYDNYDAINVDKINDIPENYFGKVGVPITFLDRYNPNQFEIVKFRKGDDEKDLSVDGTYPYFRIIIKRKDTK